MRARRSRVDDKGGRSRSLHGEGGCGSGTRRTLRRMTADAHLDGGSSKDDQGDQSALPDLRTTAGKLAQLQHKTDEAVHAGSSKAVEKRHADGRMTARERTEALLDPGSFVELDGLARHRPHGFGIEGRRPYGDAVSTGSGTVASRPVA